MFCEKCGGKLHADSRFCPDCGKEIIRDNLRTPLRQNGALDALSDGTIEYKKERAKFITVIIKNALVMLLAVIMLAFSFLPTIGIENDYYGIDLTMYISPIDCINDVIASFHNYSELSESYVYDELEDMSERIEFDPDEVPEYRWARRYKNEISKVLVLTQRLSLTMEKTNMPASLLFAGIISFAYILFVLTFFFIALFNLLGTFSLVDFGAVYRKLCVSLLVAAPIFVLGLFYVIGITYSSSSTRIHLTSWSLAVLIISAVTVTYCVIQRLLFTVNKSIKVIVLRSVVATLTLIIMAASLAPVCYTVVYDEESKKTETEMGIAEFQLFSSTDEESFENLGESSHYNEQKQDIKSLFERLITLNKKERESSVGKKLCSEIIVRMGFYTYVPAYLSVLKVAPVLYIFLIIMSSLVMWHCIRYLVEGTENKVFYLSIRLVLLFVSIALLVFVIVSVTMIQNAAKYYLESDYSFVIGVSPIFISIIAIAIAAIPALGDKNRNIEEADDSHLIDYNSVKNLKEFCYRNLETTQNVQEDVSSVVSEIKALKELCDIGAISEEEFSAKKAQLLGL